MTNLTGLSKSDRFRLIADELIKPLWPSSSTFRWSEGERDYGGEGDWKFFFLVHSGNSILFDRSSMEAVEKSEETIPGVRYLFSLYDFP